MYEHFADIYDEFMTEASYDLWADYIEELWKRHGGLARGGRKRRPKLVLDLACGTGSLTAELCRKGYEMIAVDGSAEMLELCREKLSAVTTEPPLCLQQDMREFELYGTVDSVLCTCDSLNYLPDEEDLCRVFRLVENYLEPGGSFIFDLNTRYKFEEVLADNTFAETSDDAAFIWENYFYEDEGINEYAVTFFEQTEDGRYERHEETHYERVFETERVKELLARAGLRCEAVYDAFTFDAPRADSERICFVAREYLYDQLGKKRDLGDDTVPGTDPGSAAGTVPGAEQ